MCFNSRVPLVSVYIRSFLSGHIKFRFNSFPTVRIVACYPLLTITVLPLSILFLSPETEYSQERWCNSRQSLAVLVVFILILC